MVKSSGCRGILFAALIASIGLFGCGGGGGGGSSQSGGGSITMQPPNGVISLSLAASRLTGVAPLAVFFDATGTTSTVTTKPFHDIEYRWDFGDPAGSPVSGTTWNTGSGQGANSRNSAAGALAAHVFERPGTYTVTLAAFDGTNTASTSVQIDVTDPDMVFSGTNTICIGATSFPTSGSDGCPSGAQVQNLSDFEMIRGLIATGKRVLLRRGDTFDASGTTGYVNVNGPWTLGAFGSGPKPVIRAVSGDTDLIKYGNSGGPYTDIRLMDLTLDGNGFLNVVGTTYTGGSPNPNVAAPQFYDQFLILRVDVRNAYRGFMTMQQTGVFVVDSTVVSTGYTGFSGGMIRSATMGNSFTETTIPDNGEGNWRCGNTTKLLISNNDFVGGQDQRQHLKLHSQIGTPSQYLIVGDNRLSAYASGGDVWWLEIGPDNASDSQILFDFIVERNWFTGNDVVTRYVYISESRGTVRNNVFDFTRGDPLGQNWAVSIFQFGPPDVPAPDDIQVYNNTAYSPAANTDSQGFAMVMVDEAGVGATNIVVRNNYASMPNYTNKQAVFDPFSRATVSNNTVTNTPGWVSATPSTPADFKPAPGSAAIGMGTFVPVLSDFFRLAQPSPRDLGAVNH